MFADDKLQDEMDEVQRTLLNLASSGRPQPEFLYVLTRAVLRMINARTLDLWFDDGEQIIRWSMRDTTCSAVELTLLAPVEDLLEYALRDDAQVVGAALHTPSGGVWMSGGRDSDDTTPRSDTSVSSSFAPPIAILPFQIDDQHQGVLRLELSARPTEMAVALCERVARTMGVVMAIHRAQAALTERVKELTCMYNIAQVAADVALSLEDSCQEVVALLPQAWQFPEIATARIVLDGRSFCSDAFHEGPQRMSADILVGGIQRGYVEVFYSELGYQFEDAHLADARPFLKEEHHLIQGAARELALIVERKHAESERATLQEQVRHADRLATIGTIAAGMAHELNEPLGSVLGFAQLLAKTPELDDQPRRDVERITSAALYAREVVKKLMFFARQAPIQEASIDLNRVVEEATEFLKARCAEAGTHMRCELGSGLPPIKGDRAQLQQVIVNLVVNAIQATPEGGKIRIVTAACEEGAQLTVEDSGCGIPPEHMDKVFLPFFTTKDVGQGTGLGLAVVHGIVSAHGGTIEVDNGSGEGALFRVRLPSQERSKGTG